MIGAFLAAIMFKKTKSLSLAAVGEIFGTGVIGGLLSFPIAKFILGKEVAALFYVTPFLISTIGGSIIACFVIKLLSVSKVVQLKNEA
jgi:energy coupling factor transporter S component ThiW